MTSPESASAPSSALAPAGQLPGRKSSGWLRVSSWLGYPMALAGALWICVGRGLFGAAGTLTGPFLITVGPLFLAVMLIAAWRMRQDALRYAARATSSALAIVQALTWALAGIFGFLIPDRVDGRSVSGLSQVFGDHLIGLSAGFGNTFAILTFVGAFATMIMALQQDSYSRRRSSGGPATEDEVLDAMNYNDGAY